MRMRPCTACAERKVFGGGVKFRSDVAFMGRVYFANDPDSDEETAELEARVAKLEKIVGAMVACQPSDPLGDLARAEARFDAGKCRRVPGAPNDE